MPRNHDVRPEGGFIHRQMSVMQENAQPCDDLQAGQRKHVVVIAVTRDDMTRG